MIGRRPYGELGAPADVAALHFAPIGGACYLGIACGARDVAVDGAVAGPAARAAWRRSPASTARSGLMDAKLRCSWWALMGSLDEIGDDPKPGAGPAATVMLAKRQAVLDAIEVVDLAMDVLGGRSYFRRSPLERAYRDVRAGTFHPLPPEVTLAYAGKVALGDPGVAE